MPAAVNLWGKKGARGSCPFPWRDEWTRKSWTQESIKREHFPIGWVTAIGKTFTSSSMKEKLLGRCAALFYLLLLFAFLLVFSIGKSWKISFVFSFIELSRYWDESIVFPTTRGFLQKIDFPCSTNNFHSICSQEVKKKKKLIYLCICWKETRLQKRRIN